MMNDRIDINGVCLTENMQQVLLQWQKGLFEEEQLPKMYVGFLNDTQDYLINVMLADDKKTEPVADLLTKLILIKDDLKKFIITKNEKS